MQPCTGRLQLALDVLLAAQLPEENSEELPGQCEADEKKIQVENIGFAVGDKRSEGVTGGIKCAKGNNQGGHTDGHQSAVNGQDNQNRHKQKDQ